MKYIKPFIDNKNGITLAEIIVALFLIAIVIGTTNIFFVYGINTYCKNRDKAEVAENLRVGINRLSRELRLAAEFNSYTQDSDGRVAFKDIQGKTISYHISTSGDYEAAKQLTRAIDGQANNPVARYVNSIQVEPADAGTDTRLVTVTLTGEKGRSGSMDVSTTVRLRN